MDPNIITVKPLLNSLIICLKCWTIANAPTPSKSDASLTVSGGEIFIYCKRKTKKISAVHSTAWHFWHEDLVKTELSIIVYDKSMGKLIYLSKI